MAVSAAPAASEYRVRINMFRRPATFRILPDRIEVDRAGVIDGLPFRDIRFVHAQRVIGPRKEGLRRLRIQGPGRRTLLVQSHFAHFGAFDDRSAAYDPFVRELVCRVAASSPDAAFLVGSATGAWIAWVMTLILCSAVALLAIPFAFVEPWSGLALFVGACSAIPACWSILAKGRIRPVDAERLLAEAVPRAEASQGSAFHH